MFSKDQISKPSHHFVHFAPLLLCGWATGVDFWLENKCLGCCLGLQCQEGWLDQIIFVFLCLWEAPGCTAQHITQGWELRLTHILSLWVQHLEIDCPLKETPKDLNVLSSKCVNSPYLFFIRLTARPKHLKTNKKSKPHFFQTQTKNV